MLLPTDVPGGKRDSLDHDECKDVVSEVFAKVFEEGIILLPETEEGYLIRGCSQSLPEYYCT